MAGGDASSGDMPGGQELHTQRERENLAGFFGGVDDTLAAMRGEPNNAPPLNAAQAAAMGRKGPLPPPSPPRPVSRSYAGKAGGGRQRPAWQKVRAYARATPEARLAAQEARHQAFLEDQRQSGRVSYFRMQLDARRAERAEARAERAADREAQRQAEAEQEAAERNTPLGRLRRVASVHLPTPVTRAANWTRALPTPGGLATPLIGLILFTSAIAPVGPSGETRLQMVARALLGRSNVPPTAADKASAALAANSAANSAVSDVTNIIGSATNIISDTTSLAASMQFPWLSAAGGALAASAGSQVSSTTAI